MAKTPPEPEEFEWQPVAEWSSELHAKLADLEKLEKVYSLLRADGPSERPWYMAGMDFLRQARTELRTEIAVLILELHGAGIAEPEEPKKL